jgi:hypothetical protein
MRKGCLIALFSAIALAGCSEAPEPATTDNTVLTALESSLDVGDFTIHFNAISTDQLTPEVASTYGIVRSQNRAMLTISVIRNDTPGPTASPAEVTATATNLAGQLRNLSMREIAESNAIYYIGETVITNAETLIFTIQVRPEGSSQTHTIRYMKQFFVD